MSNEITYLIEFFPGIWISNTQSLSDKFLKQKRIDRMLNCEKELNFFDNAENYIESIKKEIKKTNHHKLYKYLLEITETVHNTILKGESLLIYDQYSNRKAPIIIIAYLMRYGQLNPVQTIDSYLSKSKLSLNINEDYQIAIKFFYTQLQKVF
jgi:hypothetical protein